MSDAVTVLVQPASQIFANATSGTPWKIGTVLLRSETVGQQHETKPTQQNICAILGHDRYAMLGLKTFIALCLCICSLALPPGCDSSDPA